MELSDLVAGSKDLVKEPGDDHPHRHHLLSSSPLNAGKEEGDEEEDIREVLGEPGGKEGEGGECEEDGRW